ncbi:MAG: tetratricopeptide repeat protein [Phycisphaerae bacterium]|nr:tetratricopeptide repeat protein [Phycisphaerae bacterium]
MSKLLEIFGKAITVNASDLIWHWLNAVTARDESEINVRKSDFAEIIDLLGNGNLDDAEEKLKFYLFEEPECTNGRMVAVAICLKRNQPEEAIEHLQSIYYRQPSNTMALYILGYCNEIIGRQAQALEFYQDCVKFKSHLQLPRQRMASIYLNSGRVDRTIEQYKLLTVEHPEDISSLVLLGYLYYADGQYDNAIDTFNMAIVAHPDNFHDESQSEEAELVEDGRFDEAIERIQWLIDQVGVQADLFVRMADIYSKASMTAEAIVHYEKAIQVQPNYLEATIKLGTHFLKSNCPSKAAAQFNRAIEINDEIVDSYVGLAISQEKSGDSHEAYATLSLATAIQQNSNLLFSETATLHLQAALSESIGNCQQAETPPLSIDDVISAHSTQMQKSPRSSDIHYKFGMLMMVIGNFKAAIESFENALEINPTHSRVRCKLALCLYECDEKELAMKKLVDTEPMNAETVNLHYQTAILFCDKEKFASALYNLENTMKENYTQPDASTNIEVVLENLGLVDRAIATWDRLTETAKTAISERYE